MRQGDGHADLGFGISAIDTGYIRPGFDASHLIVHAGRGAFVDTGSALATPLLLQELDRRGVAREDVDYVLLTHVHLDHAGGGGTLMQALPNARAVLHPRGARHMADPGRLIEGTIAVYGEAAFRRLYGEVVPIDAARIVVVEDGQRLQLGDRTLEFIHTEGHARHHYCIVDHDAAGVFSGDTFGVSYRDFDTDRGAFIYPTTTPVHFDPKPAHASIDRIMSYGPRAIYLTHYSRVRELERLASDMHECLHGFERIARECADAEDRTAVMKARLYDFLAGRLDDHGFTTDAERRHELLDPDVDLNVMGLEVWLDRIGRAQEGL